jgi:hypothetical protein
VFSRLQKNPRKFEFSKSGLEYWATPVPYVRNADGSVDIPKHSLEKFVCQNARSIGKAEQAMIGENRADAE